MPSYSLTASSDFWRLLRIKRLGRLMKIEASRHSRFSEKALYFLEVVSMVPAKE
jgi:hypothetical protein